MSTVKRICLWSGPRNVSTALMYSFAHRPDTAVSDEPLYAHYLRTSGAEHPGRAEVLDSQENEGEKVVRNEILGPKEKPVFFIKNMAHHLVELDKKFLGELENIFLLRRPDQMLTSFIKQIPNPNLRDTAYKMQYDLFVELRNAGQNPLVIDSAELLKNPENILTQVCERCGIPFQKEMLNWPAGPIPEDGVWAKYWYKNVHTSTGFGPYSPKDEPVPEDLQGLLAECHSYYEQLAPYALRAESLV